MLERQGILPLVIDPAVQMLEELAASGAWLTLAVRSAHETASRVYARCPPQQRMLEGVDAANYLQAVVPLTQADILEQHSGYGPVRWFWYLRLPVGRVIQAAYYRVAACAR